ncbi:MAG TPA: dTMP kinase [Kiritimatiellia bacterium]|nr:dTMP kinase [Kiritimatiellia bacterium]HRZ11932.1 dTMP kinase [Kiritimatiellia bacterium]HSA17262.1 dTMP kinase [Kiritimatiellia bacterium]
MRGKFITFEGPEGGGKTTQARRLIARLEKDGHPVLYAREPGGTPTGEAIRDILQYDKAGEPICRETEVLLFAASRAQLVRHVILPALEAGRQVVCDRFADSTTAYQGFGRGFPVEQMLTINEFAINGAHPDLTLLLDIDVGMGFERLTRRHRETASTWDRIEREERAFHEKVRQGYLELARRWPARFRIVNAGRDPDAVEQEIWDHVRRLLA